MKLFALKARTKGSASVPAGKRVLIVDDVPEMCEALKGLLETLRLPGLQIDTVTDGFRAVDLLAENAYDLVLCDTRIPYVDGFRILAAARDVHPAGLRVLMTAYDSLPSAYADRVAAGIDGFVRKPFRALELRHILIELLQAAPEKVQAWREGRDRPILCRAEDAPPETREII